MTTTETPEFPQEMLLAAAEGNLSDEMKTELSLIGVITPGPGGSVRVDHKFIRAATDAWRACNREANYVCGL